MNQIITAFHHCLVCAIAIYICINSHVCASETHDTARFIGRVSVSPSLDRPDKPLWVLNEDFGFFDGVTTWMAKKGDITDGASIPTPIWLLLGHPFDPKYIQAAVVHDHFCQNGHQIRTWQATHRMFYEALVTTKRVEKITAKAMFYAVYIFGPRWTLVSERKSCPQGRICIEVPLVENFQPTWGTKDEVENAYNSMATELKVHDLTIEDIETKALEDHRRLRETKDMQLDGGDIGRVSIESKNR